MENLLAAWQGFRKGKRAKLDVLEFQSGLIYQATTLHEELKSKTYRHGGYHHFRISDPKPRDIHKASVRDRLLHHAAYRVLYPYFDKRFISDSYSCRLSKGTHRAMNKFRQYALQCSRNHTRTCWVLKCDIRKFFASIDHGILFRILERHLPDQNILWLLRAIVGSFSSQNIPTFSRMSEYPKGLPLGNLTSQLLVNIYLNEFDQFVKHTLRATYYIRYADDFVFLSYDEAELRETLKKSRAFLAEKLKLQLHPDKVFIKTFSSGVDFLGWIHFPDHRVLRTATKRRMFRRLHERKGSEREEATKNSYTGMLQHGNAHTLRQKI